jgi:uncharacterized hydrophobic protein (TIGR00341 family)
MAMKYVEIIADAGSSGTVSAIAEKAKAMDFRLGIVGKDGMQQMRMLVSNDNLQLALDTLQNVLGAQPTARIVVLSVEASLPKPVDEENDNEDSATAARELLYEEVEKGALLDLNFCLLTVLSTIVAAIGLIENNIAVVIGAMVIAPLLGPNLALSLGTALGDVALIRKSVKTLFVGILLAVACSAVFGVLWPSDLTSHELMSRTHAALDSILLALASGASAALSLTTGLSAVLVGVMVAVALLPPAATLGIMLGDGNLSLAMGAGLLLAVNVVCVNLASKIVFFLKGVHPRTWLEKEKAKRAMLRYVLGWIVTLLILLLLMYVRSS